jgi:hypothetical protein
VWTIGHLPAICAIDAKEYINKLKKLRETSPWILLIANIHGNP